jgi:flagellar biosynthetic protein FliP
MRSITILSIVLAVLCCAGLLTWSELAAAQSQPIVPDVSIAVGGQTVGEGESLSVGIRLMLFMTLLSFLPALLLTTTCFTRLVVVMSMTRTVMGTQQAPPNMILTGLALFLTLAIMSPVFQKMYTGGVEPYLEGTMSEGEAWQKATQPLKKFLLVNSKQKDIALFLKITKADPPKQVEDLSLAVLAPAFIVTELNLAFQIGFLIALPFLVLDMVVSSVLTSMSMITLPPVVISLPLKLMLFVVVDGWNLIISSLVKSYIVP